MLRDDGFIDPGLAVGAAMPGSPNFLVEEPLSAPGILLPPAANCAHIMGGGVPRLSREPFRRDNSRQILRHALTSRLKQTEVFHHVSTQAATRPRSSPQTSMLVARFKGGSFSIAC